MDITTPCFIFSESDKAYIRINTHQTLDDTHRLK